MSDSSKIVLSSILGALSTALDMTEGQPVGHSMRSCWIATQIGIRLGLEREQLNDLYYTALLKDVGCTANAARVCQIFLVDDLTFKRDFLAVDNRSIPKALGFLINHAGVGLDMAERFKTLVSAIKNKNIISQELVDTRCQRGAEIAKQLHFNDEVANGILCLDEHWDGGGHPSSLSGDQIPLISQISLLAQVADVLATTHGIESAKKEIKRRSGKWFNPNLVNVLLSFEDTSDLWMIWASESLEDRLFALEPANRCRDVDEDYLDDVAHAFAAIVDAKSPYTSGHSERVTLFTEHIAAELGVSKERRRWLRRAALLHDIGKLGVSSYILDKPGKLTDEEWCEIKKHPVFTEKILDRVPVFEEMSYVAAAHHERLDGLGYPYGRKEDEIPFETRIITVADIFDALTADRPYREAMPVSRALEIMDGIVGTQICPICYAALKRVINSIDGLVVKAA